MPGSEALTRVGLEPLAGRRWLEGDLVISLGIGEAFLEELGEIIPRV